MTDSIIFISNGYKGGANKYFEQHINFNLKKKVFLIDTDPQKNFERKTLKKIEFYKKDVLYNYSSTKKCLEDILKKTNNKQTVIFLTNYIIFIKYFFLLIFLKKKGIKTCITIHSGILNYNNFHYFAGFIFSFLFFFSNKVIFGSYSARKWWIGIFPWMYLKRNKVLFNGILIKKAFKKFNKKKINVSFVGRLNSENDPTFFCNFAEYFFKKHNIRFHLFGEGPMKKKLLTFKKYVTFHGWQPESIVYRNSDIVIITSYINNFPYVALEAKSYGIPVICCSKGDVKLIIKNGYDGFILKNRNMTEIVNSILKITKNYSFFRNNAFKNVKKFNLNSSCRKIWNYVSN
tara:strand:- start:8088 stop:9125 length:1038 start_codon:yes stop_codon:yes gene_type:complete